MRQLGPEVLFVELTDRKKQILKVVVEDYVRTAEPVGSKAIAASIDMEVSSATIRNEMADLEAMGLLEKPHTSAGRIPSPKGYRLYVNELMEEHKLSLQETQRINQALAMRMRELDRVLDQAGRVVSQLTNYPSFALSSGLSRMTIRRFDLLMVERTYNPTAKFPTAYIERREMTYSYQDGDLYYFMDNETFEQIPLNESELGDAFKFVKENEVCKVLSYKGKVFGVEAPNFVVLEVTKTDPGFKGNTATNTLKPATLETGAEIRVPLFINEGDMIRIDTRTGEYMERA